MEHSTNNQVMIVDIIDALQIFLQYEDVDGFKETLLNAENILDIINNSHIMELSCKYNSGFLKILIENGADMNGVNYALDKSLLHLIIENNNYDALNYLLQTGADPNIESVKGCTPLHLALEKRDAISVETLLIFNSNPNVLNNKCVSPFHYAIMREDIEFVEMIIRKTNYALVTNRFQDENDETIVDILQRLRISLAIPKSKYEEALHLPEDLKYYILKNREMDFIYSWDFITSIMQLKPYFAFNLLNYAICRGMPLAVRKICSLYQIDDQSISNCMMHRTLNMNIEEKLPILKQVLDSSNSCKIKVFIDTCRSIGFFIDNVNHQNSLYEFLKYLLDQNPNINLNVYNEFGKKCLHYLLKSPDKRSAKLIMSKNFYIGEDEMDMQNIFENNLLDILIDKHRNDIFINCRPFLDPNDHTSDKVVCYYLNRDMQHPILELIFKIKSFYRGIEYIKKITKKTNIIDINTNGRGNYFNDGHPYISSNGLIIFSKLPNNHFYIYDFKRNIHSLPLDKNIANKLTNLVSS